MVTELNPVTARLKDHAVAALAALYQAGFDFDRCYLLAVGVTPDKRNASLASLTPSELEAMIDLDLVFESWRETGDKRPPENHLEVLSTLQRLGSWPNYINGERTRWGHNHDERHSAAETGRPLRFIPGPHKHWTPILRRRSPIEPPPGRGEPVAPPKN